MMVLNKSKIKRLADHGRRAINAKDDSVWLDGREENPRNRKERRRAESAARKRKERHDQV